MAHEDAQRSSRGSLKFDGQELIARPPNCIAIASAKELTFILDLQKRFSNQIGFIPKAGIEWYVNHSRVWLCIENGDPAGYILGRPSLRFNRQITPITQAAVAMDAQRRRHGLGLLRRLEDQARAAGQLALQANCRSDLEANEFWKAAGFIPIGTLESQTARGITRICWRKSLRPFEPSWFNTLPPVAGYHAKKTHAAPTFADLFNTKS